jgi:hypothetical protein
VKKLLPWTQIDGEYTRTDIDKKIVAKIIREKMCYKAIFWKEEILIRDYFISLLAAKIYIDEKLLDQGLVE